MHQNATKAPRTIGLFAPLAVPIVLAGAWFDSSTKHRHAELIIRPSPQWSCTLADGYLIVDQVPREWSPRRLLPAAPVVRQGEQFQKMEKTICTGQKVTYYEDRFKVASWLNDDVKYNHRELVRREMKKPGPVWAGVVTHAKFRAFVASLLLLSLFSLPLSAAPLFISILARHRRSLHARRQQCPECGYCLAYNVSNKCPECGECSTVRASN